MDSTVRVLFLGNASSAVRSVGQLERGFGSLGRAAKIVTAGLAIGVVGGLVAAVKAAVAFDRQMRNVNSIAKLNEGQFKALSKQVLGLAKVTGQGPSSLAAGLYDIVSSGFKSADGLKILRASAKAATAGLTDTATSTKAVVAVLNAYHLNADKAAHVSDVLFQTVNKGVLTFEELASQIGDVLPVAAQLGVPLEDIGGALATITLHGVNAAEAATQLKQLLVSILKPSDDLKKSIHDMGFETGETALKTLGLEGFLRRLSAAAHGSGAAFANWFPNVRAMNGALGLTGKNIKTLHDNLESMRHSQGAANAAFNEQAKSISFQWQRAKASLTAAAIPIGQLLFPLLAKAAEKVGEFAQKLQSALPSIRQGFGDIASVVSDVASKMASLAGSAGGQNTIAGLITTLLAAKGIIGVKGAVAAVVGGLRALGPVGTAAAIGIGYLTSIFIASSRSANRYADDLQRIIDKLHQSHQATMTAAQADRNLEQARINMATTAQQLAGVEALLQRTRQQTPHDLNAIKAAELAVRQARANHTQAIADEKTAEDQATGSHQKATRSAREAKQAIADLATKANDLAGKYQNLVDKNTALAKAGSGAAESNRRVVAAAQGRVVDAYAAVVGNLARQLGVGASKANDYADAVRTLSSALGRLPTFKEVRIFVSVQRAITTVNSVITQIAHDISPPKRAMGGAIPGATGAAVPVLAHAGEIILNPRQQQALGGPRFLSQLFGFTGPRSGAFAEGGIVGNDPRDRGVGDRKPRISRSRRSPHHPLRSRRISSANARVNAALANLHVVDRREEVHDRHEGQLAREFDISQEQFLVDVTDPSTGETYQVVDAEAVAHRLGEIDTLVSERQKMLGLLDEENKELGKAIAVLRAAIAELLAAIKAEQDAAKADAAEIKKLTAKIEARNTKIEADRKRIRENQQAIADDRTRIRSEEAKGKSANKTLIANLRKDIDKREDQNRTLHGGVHDLLVANTGDRKSISAHRTSQTAHTAKAREYASELNDWKSALADQLDNRDNVLPYDRVDVNLDIETLNAERLAVAGTSAPGRLGGGGGGAGGGGGEEGAGGGGGGGGGGGSGNVVRSSPSYAALQAQIAALKLALGIQNIQVPIIGQFHRGQMYVPETGLYQLEAGERVVPKQQTAARGGDDRPIELHLHLEGDDTWARSMINAELQSNYGRILLHAGREADHRRREGRS